MSDAYRILHDASLRGRNTFGVEAHAARLIEIDDARALPEIAAAEWDDAPVVLGGGSNLLFAGDPTAPSSR